MHSTAQHGTHGMACTAHHAQHGMHSMARTAWHIQHGTHSTACTAWHAQHGTLPVIQGHSCHVQCSPSPLCSKTSLISIQRAFKSKQQWNQIAFQDLEVCWFRICRALRSHPSQVSPKKERESLFYIFSQPTRLYRCARAANNLVNTTQDLSSMLKRLSAVPRHCLLEVCCSVQCFP